MRPGHGWMHSLRCSALLTILASLPSSVCAQAVNSLQEVQGLISQGDVVSVTCAVGCEIRGTVVSVSSSDLQLALEHGERSFEAAEIQQIDRLLVDGVTDGAMWGLLAGASAGAVTLVAVAPGLSLGAIKGVVPLILIGCPLVGLAVGTELDRAAFEREPIFLRRGGGRVSLTWDSWHGGLALRVCP